MTRIDTGEWRQFRVGDYFEELKAGFIGSGRKIGTATTEPDSEHVVPLTCAKYGNNGVMYYGRAEDYITYENVLSVIRDGAVSTGMVYAQKTATGVYSHSYFIRVKGTEVTFLTNLFLSRVLQNTIYPRYTRDDTCIWKKISEELITLPATEDGEPDWSYMDRFMARIMEEASATLDAITKIGGGGNRVSSHDWKAFRIGGEGGLFRIEKGTRLTRADMEPGPIPFIGASTANNGITGFVGNTEHIHPGNVITVAYNGQKATGKAFYQPSPFWASDDVHVLYPNFELNEPRALFLLPIFRIVGEPYAFENKWKIEFMEKDELPLPAKKDGTPDWELIEESMLAVKARTEGVYEALEMA